MFPRLCSAALLALAGVSPAFALDLTPASTTRELEGVAIPVLIFRDGARRLSWQPPGEWTASGGGSALTLRARGAGQGYMKLLVLPKKNGPAPLPPAEAEAFARSLLPTGAEQTTLEKQTENPFTLEGKGSTEWQYTYGLYASRERTSVALIDRSDREWLAVIITASPQGFEEVHAQGTASLFSWRPLL